MGEFARAWAALLPFFRIGGAIDSALMLRYNGARDLMNAFITGGEYAENH